jgi:hypothetical protein
MSTVQVRKLQEPHRNHGYFVNIPKNWATSLHLSKADLIRLELSGNRISLERMEID